MCFEWYENGQAKNKQEYKNGIRTGKWLEWNETGRLKLEIEYFETETENKKLERRFEYNREETFITYSEWFENGNRRLEQQMKNGRRHGTYKEWFENGNPSMETQYNDGQEDGLHKDWYENGNIRMESEIKNGKRHGFTHFWNEDGIKQWIQLYAEGIFVRRVPVY
jgi:antitoxin component YwqK of YwqJK toxin-antitoxin module